MERNGKMLRKIKNYQAKLKACILLIKSIQMEQLLTNQYLQMVKPIDFQARLKPTIRLVIIKNL